MRKIVIVGGGFAGISALKTLAKFEPAFKLTLIDKKESSDFLPCLPDVIGKRIAPDFLQVNLRELTKKIGCEFIKQEVKSINLEDKSLTFDSGSRIYDYLLLCSGTQTNFFGDQVIEKESLKLDNLADAQRILKALKTDTSDQVVVVGGGYSGIEIATNIRRYCMKHKKTKKIIIIEKSPALLGRLPQWIKDYVQKNLNQLNIQVLTSANINQVQGKYLLIWAAGVRSADYIFKLNPDKNPQGRLAIDPYLKLTDSCFVAGDIASFNFNGQPLRMAIQFSIKQGNLAARNILNTIAQKPLLECKPVDLGYIIPMANNKSCGIILGLKVKGIVSTFFHYFMCVFRSLSSKNRWGIFKNLIKGGV